MSRFKDILTLVSVAGIIFGLSIFVGMYVANWQDSYNEKACKQFYSEMPLEKCKFELWNGLLKHEVNK